MVIFIFFKNMDSTKSSIDKCFKQMKKLQEALLALFEAETQTETVYQELINTINDLKITTNGGMLRSFLHLLSNIYDGHFHRAGITQYIKKVLLLLRGPINQFISNQELFNIFKPNNQFLLFHGKFEDEKFEDEKFENEKFENEKFEDEKFKNEKFENEKFENEKFEDEKFENEKFEDEKFENEKFENEKFEDEKFKNEKFENEKFENEKFEDEKIMDEKDFEEKSQNETVDDKIYNLIKNDSIEDFIVYVNQQSINLSSVIYPLLLETSSFLDNFVENSQRGIELIEYAAFFGSIQIFEYLLKKVSIDDIDSYSIWKMAIHSNNSEIISILEDKKIKIHSYTDAFYFSIICHHNDIAYYFLEKIPNDKLDKNKILKLCLKYYNFEFIEQEIINKTIFNYLCRYDYLNIVEILLKSNDIDINYFYTIFEINIFFIQLYN